MKKLLILTSLAFAMVSCGTRSRSAHLSDDALLDTVERYTIRYFTDFADPSTGMARERNNDSNGNIVTVGGSGFGVMAIVAGAERGYFSKEEGVERLGRITSFLERAERFHGAWAHWYDADSEKTFSFSEFDDGGDLVETAFMVQGLLAARQWLRRGGMPEGSAALSDRMDALWKDVEWSWYTRGTDSLYWHWSKNWEWKMNHRISGYDETLITYVLAASSPTWPISRECYETSYKTSDYYYNGKEYFGITLPLGMELYGGPLFFSHYSYLGLDPRGLEDGYCNYFERNKAHSLIHYEYAKANPRGNKGLGENLWGFTSSDDYQFGYTSHNPGTQEENGTVSPTAAISSIPYTPKESMQVVRYLYDHDAFGPYGFYDAYNEAASPAVLDHYLAIDQGPEAVMIENYRSGLLWELFMSCPEVKAGLDKLGFNYNNQ
ncbi:MAG: beta-glucosidase [Bacteroidales bacterium]|nr:beta-glucosidase [Bacteroidales bacterium]